MLLGRNQDALHGMSSVLLQDPPHPASPSIPVLSGADATPGETRTQKTEYISRMPETTPPEPPSGPQPGRWVLSHGEIRTIVFGLMLAMFLAALNQTIVATALPTIGRDFRDFELLPWVVTAYLLKLDRGRAAARKAQRHSRAPRHDASRRSASSPPVPSPAPWRPT